MPRVGRSPWLNRIAELRQDEGAAQAPKGRGQADAVRAPKGADTPEQRALVDAGVPDKVAAQHGRALHAAAEQVDRFAVAGHGLDGWRKKSFSRLQGQAYKTLGQLLSALPEGRRASAAKEAVRALADLAHDVGATDRLGPALNAAVGLVDGALRQAGANRLALEEADYGALFGAAVAAVRGAIEGLEGRAGVGTSLNTLSTLADHLAPLGALEGAGPLEARWRQAAAVLTDVAPKAGLTLDGAAQLARALSDAVRARPEGPVDAVVDAAAEAFHAPRAQAQADVLAHFAQDVALPNDAAKATHARVKAVLTDLVQARPGGSDALFAAAQTFYDQATARLQGQPPATLEPLLDVVASLRDVPSLEGVLALTQKLLVSNRQTPEVVAALDKAIATPGGGAAAHLLQALSLAQRGRVDYAALEGDFAAAGAAAWPVAATLAGTGTLLSAQLPDLAQTVLREAQTCGRDDLLGHLARFGAHLEGIGARLQQINLQPPEAKAGAAAALARLGTHRAGLGNLPVTAGQFLQQIGQQVPGADLEAACTRTLFDLADPEVHWRFPANQILPTLLAGLNRANLPNNAEVKREAVDAAVRMTAEVAYLDGDYRIPFQRIHQDFAAAFAEPGKLTCLPERSASPRKGARATVHDYLAAHPELPMELALTAGVHLKPAQMKWLAAQIEGTRGRDTVRQLRDLVFAAVDANRLDLVDALMGTKTAPKAVRALVSVVARDYRENKLAQIPFDDLVAGLKAGEDPITRMERQKVEAALGQLKLEGDITPEGSAELGRSAEAIRYMLEYTVPGKQVDGMSADRFKAPFEAAVNAVANGRWPEWKYEGEVADRIFAALTPQQLEVWKSETVYSGQGPAAADAGEDAHAFAQARAAMKGIFKHIEQVQLPSIGGKKLSWDAASLERAEGQLDALLEQVRAADKGTDAHRVASRKLGPVRQAVALLRFHAASARLPADAKQALKELAPILPEAAQAFRKVGFSAGQEAVQDALHLLQSRAPSSPKEGIYAVDEDGFHASLTSTTGGCIVYNGVRRWATLNVAVNPHEKILRAHEGGAFQYRACLKLFEAKIDGYEGPILWMNYPNRHGGGGPQHLEALLKAAMAKADALGVPLVTAWTQAKNHAFLGMEQKNITVKVDDGRTDSSYVDYRFQSPRGGYAHDLPKARGDKPRFEVTQQLFVRMP